MIGGSQIIGGTRVLRCAVAAGAVAALVAAVSVPGAGAATATTASASANRTFAGWEVTKTRTHITSATVTFVVPRITCHKNFSGVGPSVLIDSTVHNGTYNQSGGGVAVSCQNGQPVYLALPIVDSHDYDDYNVSISPGDRVTLTVKYGTKTTVTLVDHTDGQTDVRSGKKSRGEYAYFGDSGIEINHKGVGLDPFTKTSFSAAKVNGHTIGSQSPKRYKWVDKSHNTLVSASKLRHGADFSTTFIRST